MLTNQEFENLIKRSESSILDFKKSMYAFTDDADFKNTANFVKDVISFSNTIRNETSYIIIGIKEKEDGEKELHGIDIFVDEAIFQNKVKDKVFPRPKFDYYVMSHENKKFGVFAFPVVKYETPIFPVEKMKGIEIGKIYFRRGTTNSEAIGMEGIQINNWLQSLPRIAENESLQDHISKCLKRLTAGHEKLSAIFPDIILIAKKFNLQPLNIFCSQQLTGLTTEVVNSDPSKYSYRVHDVIISLNKIDVNPYSFGLTPAKLKYEMGKNAEFYEYRMLFVNPIFEIEDYLNRQSAIVTTNSKNVIPESTKDYPVYVYIFNETFSGLYKSIRQKAIDSLMTI